MGKLEFDKVIELLKKKPIMPIVKKYLKNKKVLDVGCGNGMVAQTLFEEFNCDISLLDVVDLRRKGINNFPFVIASADKLPYKDNFFEVVFMQFVLYHIDSKIDIKRVLQEAARVSSKRIIIYEEVAGEKTDHKKAKEYDEFVNIEIHDGYEMKNYKYYYPDELEKIFKEVGLKIKIYKLIELGREKAGFIEKHLWILDK